MYYHDHARIARIVVRLANRIAREYDDAACMIEAHKEDPERYKNGPTIAAACEASACQLQERLLKMFR